MLRDSRSYEAQIIDAVRSVNKALGGTYGTSSAIHKNEFNQYEVQLIDAIKGIGKTLSGNGLSLAGGGVGEVTAEQFQALSQRVTKLESESFFRLVNGNVTLKEQYQNLWVPGWLAAGGIGSESGGGVSYLRELSDVYHDDYGVLNANGGSVQPGDTIVYNDQLGWVAAPITVSGVVKKIACGGYNTLSPDANGLVDITQPVLSQVQWYVNENIIITRNLTTGTPIAAIQLAGPNSQAVQLYAPSGGGGGGGSTVTVSPRLYSGVPIADITVDGSTVTLYAPSGGGGVSVLDDLNDVYITNPGDGQALVYRNGYWQNETIPGGGGGGSYSSGTGISINSNNVISISTAYQQKIAKGEDAYNSISALADRITAIEGWFEVVTVSGQSALHAKSGRAIYSDSWISAGGVGSGGGGGGGVTSLYALDEVLSSTSPSTNQVFYFNGSKWTATALKTVGGTSLIGSGNIPISGGGGTVTSVDMTVPSGFSVTGRPITTSGTLAVSLDSQTRNKFLASPASSSGTPSFRTIVESDIPDLSDKYVTLDTTQNNISGEKTFITNPLNIAGSSGLKVASKSYIDLGPIRIKFENNALHITKADPNDQNNYGIYADGFVSAGGVGQSS